MMRFQTLLATALGSLLVAPGLTRQSDELATLHDALERTLRGLEVLTDVEARVAADPAAAPQLARSITEAPIPGAQERDQRLTDLRNEVNLLQMEVDALEAPISSPSFPPLSVAQDPLQAMPPVHKAPTGLDEELRAMLGAIGQDKDPADGVGISAVPEDEATQEFEGYSADALAQGKACYHAGKYDRGLKLFSGLGQDAGALYWKARCLEKLDRLAEAEAALEGAIAAGNDAEVTERAKNDLEFVRWKRGFAERMAQDKARVKK